MSDYHLHLLPHAVDAPIEASYSVGLIERYVEVAAARGVDELCFTEHLYRCRESADLLGRFWEVETPDVAEVTRRMVELDRTVGLDSYVETVILAKDRGLPVRLGLEIDFFPETIDRVLDRLAGYPFDFLLGSVHWVGGLATDVEALTDEIQRRGIRATWESYAGVVEELGRGGHVDAIAHVDVLKKYGLRPEHEPFDLYDGIVGAAAAGGTAIEINTAGLRNPAAELYPAPDLLARAFAAGVPITLGSDAHEPAQAGHAHDAAVSAARAAGYTTHLRFEARVARAVPL